MTLITRLSRLFRADMHAILDRIEEPELLLRQAVREMEEALAGEEQRLRLMQHELEQLQCRDAELAQALAEIGEELDVCFSAGEEALARVLIRRRLEHEQLRRNLHRQRGSLRDAIETLDGRLHGQRGQLESVRQQEALLSAGAGAGAEPDRRAVIPVRDADVEIAFLREKQSRSGS
jgi:phage shock protein A